MSDKPIDLDALSDEDFLKLDEQDAMNAIDTQKPDEEDQNAELNSEENLEDDGSENVDGDQPSVDGDESGDAGVGDDPNASEEEGQEDPDGNQDPLAGEGKPADEDADKSKDGKPDADTKEKGKKTPEASGSGKLPEGVTYDQANAALDFFNKITAPFKADGKDFSVRTPEDAIRLMQQGVNYSRRNQEIKPLKAMSRLLSDHGLNDEKKISFLIDVAKGDKAAITKLLKDNNLDPMDLDVSAETGYQAKSYAGDPQDNAFRDALDSTIAIPEGQALVSEIHKTWDEVSKAKLRENPGILGNLVELKQSGVYQQVVDELKYQRALGYLTQAPFLEAFDQVGEAMKNAGVLKTSNPQPAPQSASMGNLQTQPQTGQPVALGARKAQSVKKDLPNPHLSSTPPSKQTNNQQAAEPDFDKLSDEDFLKMAPPQ